MVLLTGATGYLGSQVARQFAERRIPFRVLVRDASRLGFDPGAADCSVFVGDLTDSGALEKAMRGAKQVVHTAALVKMWVRDRRDFERVNVNGLKELLRAAADAGVERVVYTSSFIALGPSSDLRAGEELRHPGPFANEYEATKAHDPLFPGSCGCFPPPRGRPAPCGWSGGGSWARSTWPGRSCSGARLN